MEHGTKTIKDEFGPQGEKPVHDEIGERNDPQRYSVESDPSQPYGGRGPIGDHMGKNDTNVSTVSPSQYSRSEQTSGGARRAIDLLFQHAQESRNIDELNEQGENINADNPTLKKKDIPYKEQVMDVDSEYKSVNGTVIDLLFQRAMDRFASVEGRLKWLGSQGYEPTLIDAIKRFYDTELGADKEKFSHYV